MEASQETSLCAKVQVNAKNLKVLQKELAAGFTYSSVHICLHKIKFCLTQKLVVEVSVWLETAIN